MAASDHPYDPLFEGQRDPLADLHDEGNGVADLRDGRAALQRGDAAQALESLARARALGLPAAAGPLASALEAIAQLQSGDAAAAQRVLADAWRSYPDAAALPALLGCAQTLDGDHAQAARTLFAALIGDDPDQTLTAVRPFLTALLRKLP